MDDQCRRSGQPRRGGWPRRGGRHVRGGQPRGREGKLQGTDS